MPSENIMRILAMLDFDLKMAYGMKESNARYYRHLVFRLMLRYARILFRYVIAPILIALIIVALIK